MRDERVSRPPSNFVAVKSGAGRPRTRASVETAGSGGADPGWLEALATTNAVAATTTVRPPQTQANDRQLNPPRTGGLAVRRRERSLVLGIGRSR